MYIRGDEIELVAQKPQNGCKIPKLEYTQH